MNETQVKIKIILMRLVDWTLLIAVFGTAIWAIVYAEHGEMIAMASLVGLYLVNWLGNYTNAKIAALRVDMEIEKRKQKQQMERDKK